MQSRPTWRSTETRQKRRVPQLYVRPQNPITVRTEARFALSSRAGPRSTIWKAWVAGNEGYIASRMFGRDMKVSFHLSGQCQWSATDTWVRRQKTLRNAERHVHRCQVTYPVSSEAFLLFRVEVPGTELGPFQCQRMTRKSGESRACHWAQLRPNPTPRPRRR